MGVGYRGDRNGRLAPMDSVRSQGAAWVRAGKPVLGVTQLQVSMGAFPSASET